MALPLAVGGARTNGVVSLVAGVRLFGARIKKPPHGRLCESRKRLRGVPRILKDARVHVKQTTARFRSAPH